MSLLVTDIVVGPRHRKEYGDIKALANSIADVGLLQPIVIREDRTLVAGGRRLEAVKSLGWEKVNVRVVKNLTDARQWLRAERDENTCREALKPSELAALAEELSGLESAEAKVRMKAGRKAAGKRGETRKLVAEAVGVSEPTLSKIKEVVAKGTPEDIAEMDSKGKVNGVHKRVKARERSTTPNEYSSIGKDLLMRAENLENPLDELVAELERYADLQSMPKDPLNKLRGAAARLRNRVRKIERIVWDDPELD